jgi:hypothetical protein
MMPLVRSRSVKEPLSSRVLFPLVERRFTYREYERFLDRLAARRVVPLREFARGEGDLALRHDVDLRLESALELARLEHDRGLRASYFVLHSAPYYERPDLLERLRELQELGHEVGWHNDLVTLELVGRRDAAAYLGEQLARLREAGLEVTGVAAHGSPWCHRLGFHNQHFFSDLDRIPEFPAQVQARGTLADFGFDYDAYHLGEDVYFSDSRFEHGRRAHPADLELVPGRRTVALIHPCHWDASAAAKAVRLARRIGARARVK